MAFDEGLAERIRRLLDDRDDVQERKMFGGLAFLLGGHMCCGVSGGRLMLRVGPAAYEAALAEPHAREMTFTGRPMRGFVYVESAGLVTDVDLRSWLGRATAFVASLPPKQAARPRV